MNVRKFFFLRQREEKSANIIIITLLADWKNFMSLNNIMNIKQIYFIKNIFSVIY
jgi:hypothetical protein